MGCRSAIATRLRLARNARADRERSRPAGADSARGRTSRLRLQPRPRARRPTAPPGACTAARRSPGPRLPRRPAAAPNARPIRVDADQLDDLVGLAGELAVLSDNLMGLREVPGATRGSTRSRRSQRVSRQIRDTTLDLRMVPVDELFSRFPRVVRDLADRSRQGDRAADRRAGDAAGPHDRRAAERPDDPPDPQRRRPRARAPPRSGSRKGKPRVGRITLSAGHEGDRVAIRVEDDGRGLDRERIVRKGIALGMVPHGNARRRPARRQPDLRARASRPATP